MQNFYRVFGLICESDVELPAFEKSQNSKKIDFRVMVTQKVPDLKKPILDSGEGCSYNETEFYLEVENTAKYLVREGGEIWIEPKSEDWGVILLFFYSNCIGALLFQRDLIPFHVSGIFDKKGKVWLFAAPSQTGKSTLAIKLKERGYAVFTDDTALIFIKDGRCLAVPSYPMIRAWKKTLENQTVFHLDNASRLRIEVEKYGMFFHEQFSSEPQEVKGIVFLEESGEEIKITNISSLEALSLLGNNVYRSDWVSGMKKDALQFRVLTSIAQHCRFWKAIRPKNKDSFDSFPSVIHKQLLERN